MILRRALVWLLICLPACAQLAPNRYALILEDPPVASRLATGESAPLAEAVDYRQQIEARQGSLRAELASRQIPVTGSVTTLLNAVFVLAPKERVAELRSLAGVLAVVPQRRYQLELNRATQLVNAPAAWNLLGGIQGAGRGVKIGILDTGIDQTHPALQDSSLSMPSGYPICSGSDCAFTSNKVIVARSFVQKLAAGTDPTNPAADSRPDDFSPRDRQGHGTAIASVVAGVTNAGVVTFNGMAPKAYLGNYKIYGSPEVNEFSYDGVMIEALEYAFNDGMDIVSFSTGGPAFSGPLDSGAVCGNPAGVACDSLAQAFENAAKLGLIIVAAGGNGGEDGNYPTFNSISSPADAPSVIAVGATSNSHYFTESVSVTGPGASASLRGIAAVFGDALIPPGAVAAPLVDVSQLGNDGLACSSLPAYSLDGAFALIKRGTCNFSVKMTNAVLAGAVGVIFYMADSSTLFVPSGLSAFAFPAVIISNTDGLALKSYIDANPGQAATIDPAGIETNWPNFNQLLGFSSFGPTTGDSAIKPDLVAPGIDMYMAAQSYDPLGFMYSSNGYAAAAGTSFATPMVSGAAALVKQNRPGLSGSQVKSVLVNTASQDVTTDESGNAVGVQWLGAGKLNAGAAVSSTVTVSPSSLSFGALKTGTLPASRQMTITNLGSSAVTLALAIVPANQAAGVTAALDKQTLSLGANASGNNSGTVTMTLSGSLPAAGSYTGVVTLQAAGISLRVPYMFLVGSGAAANIIPLSGSNFDGTVGQPLPEGIIAFKLVDAYGLPVSGAAVTWAAQVIGSSVTNADKATDAYGIAAAEPILGPTARSYTFTGSAGGRSITFSGNARLVPTIAANGVVDSASFSSGRAVAPGSYISIFGSALSDYTDVETSARLPLAIDYVNVSFDVPSAGISVPGRLVYVSPTQVNVQVPWELQGQTSAQMKVTIDYSVGNVVKVSLADYAPAFFETSPGVVAALDASNAVIGSGNAARRGQVIQVFANGLGPVTNQPASGEPAQADPNLSRTTTQPVVTIGGHTATVSFSGLTPTLPGLYQLNVVVPPDLTAGTWPISVTIGGKSSPSASLPVQ